MNVETRNNWTDEDLMKFAIDFFIYRSSKKVIPVNEYLKIWKDEQNNTADRENNNNLPS